MKRALPLAALLLLAASSLRAQPVDVEISPAAPSSAEPIRVTLAGFSACPFASQPAILGQLVTVSFSLGICLAPPTPFTLTRFIPPLDAGRYRLVILDDFTGEVVEALAFEVSDAGEPPAPGGEFLESAAVPGFRFKVRITDPGGTSRAARFEPGCLPETLCASGALEGRSEVLLRVVGPKPNGFLWPTFVRFTTSTIEIWAERTATGELKYYRLDGAVPGSDELDGRFDRQGFAALP